MIRTVRVGDKTGYLITKSGLAVGAAFLGAAVMGAVISWIALGNTNSLVDKLENVVGSQKMQVIEAKEANCKLKLYDILSGRAGTVLFKKANVLSPLFERGITHTLEIVESIPSNKNCTSFLKNPKSGSKKQSGGLTPSDIRYANQVLGEVLEEPRGLQHRQEEKIKRKSNKNIKRKHHKNYLPNTKKNNKEETNNSITSPPLPVLPSLPPIPSAVESKHEKHEEKREEHKEKKQENKKCIAEADVELHSSHELKICT